MTIHEARLSMSNGLKAIYPEGEAGSIADWVVEYITGAKKTDRITYKDQKLDPKQEQQFAQSLQRLLSNEPVQYILNEAWFCGLKFYVDKNVLVPRPETEELVEWIITHCKFPVDELRILDIGTGSGCIPVTLKRRIRKAEVWSCDASGAALGVARRNAESLGAELRLIELDFLNKQARDNLPAFDIIVSNPPYIPVNEKETMRENVVKYEPGEALFVPDNDPLVFYKAIAEFGSTHLTPKGSIYTEIHESLGGKTIAIFEAAGYIPELKKDMQGKDRMIRSVMDS